MTHDSTGYGIWDAEMHRAKMACQELKVLEPAVVVAVAVAVRERCVDTRGVPQDLGQLRLVLRDQGVGLPVTV